MSKLVYKISKIKDGNTAFKYGEKEEVLNNRKNIFKKIDLELEDTAFMAVEMKDNIITVDHTDKGKGAYESRLSIVCDAFITKEKDLGMYLDVGDCLPILIHDPMKDILSVIHGGWPNTDLKIVQKVIKQLIEKYNSNVKDLEIVIGPGIQKESLIYDENIFNLIRSDWKEYIYKDNSEEDKYHIDNLGFTLQQLNEVGVLKENIFVDNTDTYSSKEYFSHVRDYRLNQKDQGRFCIIAKITD